MPTSVTNPRVVLILRLICHDEIVYNEIIFCETSLSVKVNCTFLHRMKETCTKLTSSNNQLLYQEKVKPMGFSPFHFDQITSTKVT